MNFIRQGLFFMVLGVVYAHTVSAHMDDTDDPKHHERHMPLIPYLGIVGGIERLSGRQSESFTNAGATTVMSLNRRMLENNSTLSFVGGFLWKFPPLDILMGPEFFFGRGNAGSSFFFNDTANNSYSNNFQRKFFYGGLIRVGSDFCHNYFTWFSVGIDRSQFMTKRVLTLAVAPIGTYLASRTKGFNGVLIGLGIERSFKNVIVGLDLKRIQYKRQLPTDDFGNGASLFLSVRPVIYSAAIRLCHRF